jgi:hypothetical protein
MAFCLLRPEALRQRQSRRGLQAEDATGSPNDVLTTLAKMHRI